MNKINFSIYFYIIEFFYRFFYIFVSFCCCCSILYLNIQILFLIETYPFLQFSEKKFIATHVTDLFDCIWLLLISTSFLSIFPLFIFHLIQFFKTSWYKSQFYLAKWLLIFPTVIYWVFLFLCYLNIFPLVLSFLEQWEIKKLSSILSIEVEFRILSYLTWILSIRYFMSFFNFILFVSLINFILLFDSKDLYRNIKRYRKQFSFSTILTLFFFIPPDIYLQFFVIFITFIFYEIIFFFLCYKICNLN